jgi:hypothetical protein
MTLKQLARKIALERSKPEAVMPISFEQKLHGAIAKAANAVVKHDRLARRVRHNNTSSLEP